MMIKHLKYIFTVAIALMATAGCQEDIEDTFPTDPIAPVLTNNGTILMTQNTMTESVTWSWSAARFMAAAPTYSLFVQYAEETPKQVGASTQELLLTMPKTELRTLLEGFTTIPDNSTFDVNFYVTANDGANTYTSTKQLVKVYAYGDAVSPEVTAEQPEVVLDMTTPTAELTLLSWTDARLVYGEAITYTVSIAYDGGEPKEVASGLTTNSVMKTVDEWNELAISAGAPEGEAADLQFTVTAFSDSYPDGVPSTPVTIHMTTYLATFPAQLYLPGSYQGWTVDNTATLKVLYQSTLTKGLFEGFVDLTTTDGADVEFKFNPELGWNNVDFGIAADAEVTTDGDGNVVVKAAVGGDNKNVKVPSGFYRVSLNKKLNTLEMLKVESVGIIGDATPGEWSAETPMTYDAATNTYSVTTTMVSGKEYKFRMNNNWTFAIGSDGTMTEGSANYKFDKADGEYKIVLDVNKHPYAVKVLSTAYPEKLYLPGSYQGWSPASAPTLEGDGEGLYEGGVNMVTADGADCEWKFSPNPAWVDDFSGVITLTDGAGTGTIGGSANIKVPSGYYYIKVDMTQGTFEMLQLTKVGLIGAFNGWGGDADFAYDATTDLWTLTQELPALGDGFKIRFNGGWDVNRGMGGDAAGVVSMGAAIPVYHNGQNMQVAEDGTYTFTLDLSTNPNTMTVKKN